MKQLLRACLIGLMLVSCNDDEPVPFEPADVTEPMESAGLPGASASLTGMFTSFAHGLSGNASLYNLESQQRIIRLEDFTMTAGPDVYVFLSKSNNYSRGNTISVARLNMGYNNLALDIALSSAIDLDTYPFVLVYCVQYNSLFGFAELK